MKKSDKDYETTTEKCDATWCDVYDMTPWKAQCSYEGTGKCGAEAEYIMETELSIKEQLQQRCACGQKDCEICQAVEHITKIEKEAVLVRLDREAWKNEYMKERELADNLYYGVIDGNTDKAIEIYETTRKG